MDPEGVREGLLVQAADNGYFGIEKVVRSLPYRMRLHRGFFRGIHLPLTHPLPKRIDRTFQGYVGLNAYDLIVLADIDPQVLDPQDQLNLVAYVEGGGALLVIGGTHSFGNAEGSYALLDSVLPVTITREESIRVQAAPRTAGAHPITGGLVGELGRVDRVHLTKAKPGATTVLEVADRPLLVVGECQKGRAAVLTTYPECQEAVGDCFFTNDFYDDLMRQVFDWLFRVESFVDIKMFTPPEKKVQLGESSRMGMVLSAPTRRNIALRLAIQRIEDGIPDPVAVEPGDYRYQIAYSDGAAPPAGEPGEDAEVMPVQIAGDTEVESMFQAPADASGIGEYEVRFEGFSQAGECVFVRDCKVSVTAANSLDLRIRSDKRAIALGTVLEFYLGAAEGGTLPGDQLEATVDLIDSHGELIQQILEPTLLTSAFEIQYPVPNLANGAYQLVARLYDQSTGGMLDQVTEDLYVVDPPVARDFFPIACTLPTDSLDPERCREEIDNIHAHGFNCVELGQTYDWENVRNCDHVMNLAECHAQARGLATRMWGDLTLLASKSFYERRTTVPCVNAPTHRAELEQHLLPILATANKIPRLIGMEIIDEPIATPATVCYCQHCQRRYREENGISMPRWEDLEGLRDKRRADFFQSVSQYYAEGFLMGYEIIRDYEARFDVNHTFCAVAFGQRPSSLCLEDALAWAPHADAMDFDIYPYMYPHWRCSHELRFHQLHYNFAAFRAIARYLEMPLGFWVEMTDRDYPQTVAPVRSSSEIAYTAIGQGAAYLRTFSRPLLATGQGVREERWSDLGRELNRIRRVSPLLTRVSRPKAKLAMLYPHTNWIFNPKSPTLPPGHVGLGYYRNDDRPFNDYYPSDYLPFNAYELFFRAFGELDVLHEKLLEHGELDAYRCLILLGTDYLSDAAVETIINFVEKGGILVCDKVRIYNEFGEPKRGMDRLFGDREIFLADDLTLRMESVGQGKTLLFSRDLDDMYTQSIEREDSSLRFMIEQSLREFFVSEGLLPFARSDNQLVEIGALTGQNCFLLVVTNHGDQDTEATITIPEPPFEVDFARDLITMEDVDFEVEDEAITFTVPIEERRGRILGFYPEAPDDISIDLERDIVKRGTNLSYRVSVWNEDGEPAKGCHVVEVTVVDATGRETSRYGGPHTTTDGLFERTVELAINEVPGVWKISAYDRYTRQRSEQSFRVT